MTDEQTKELFELQRRIVCLLSEIADIEERLDKIKKETTDIYEQNENKLNGV